MPILSIIIPVYNAGSSIRTITSRILDQPFKDFELILVDDGSTDDTINTLRGVKKGDSRITILSKKNGGPSSARNMGLNRARGTYVMFLDADDDINPKIFTKMIQSMERSASDVVISGWRVDKIYKGKLSMGYRYINPKYSTVKGDSQKIKTFIVRSIGESGQLYNLWNKIFKLDIIKRNNLCFREDLKFGEDLIFSFQYFSHVQQLSLIPDALYYYRSSSTGGLYSKSALVPRYRQENLKELERFVGDNKSKELSDLTDWVMWRWLISYYLTVSDSSLNLKEKLIHIRKAPTNTLRVAKSSRYIGMRKWCIEIIMSIIHRLPWLSLLFGLLVNPLKRVIVR